MRPARADARRDLHVRLVRAETIVELVPGALEVLAPFVVNERRLAVIVLDAA